MAKRLRVVHIRRPQSGEGCPLRTFSRQGGFLLFGAKNFEFYGMSARTRREGVWASADILRTKGEGSIFRDFVRTSFMGGP